MRGPRPRGRSGRRACVREAGARGRRAGRRPGRRRRRSRRRRPRLPPARPASPAQPPPSHSPAGGGGGRRRRRERLCRRLLVPGADLPPPPPRAAIVAPRSRRGPPCRQSRPAPRRSQPRRGSARGLGPARAERAAIAVPEEPHAGQRGPEQREEQRTGGRAAPGPGRPRSRAPAPPPAPGRPPAEEGAAVSGPRSPARASAAPRGSRGPRGRRRSRGRALSSLAPPPPSAEPSTLRPLSPPDHGRRRRAVRGRVRAVRGDRQVSLRAGERECGRTPGRGARGRPHPNPRRARPLPPGPSPAPVPLTPSLSRRDPALLPGGGAGAARRSAATEPGTASPRGVEPAASRGLRFACRVPGDVAEAIWSLLPGNSWGYCYLDREGKEQLAFPGLGRRAGARTTGAFNCGVCVYCAGY